MASSWNPLGKLAGSREALIFVNHRKNITYPPWAQILAFPQFEQEGPARYPLSSVGLWLYEGQKPKIGPVHGRVLFDHLVHSDSIKNCLSLRDGLAIQERKCHACVMFCRIGNILLWKSAVLFPHCSGRICVPYLYCGGGSIAIHWLAIDNDEPGLDHHDFTAHFR